MRWAMFLVNFANHATSILIAELFELHDKSRFELFAFDNGFDDGSELRQRINSAFDSICGHKSFGGRSGSARDQEGMKSIF